MLSTDIMYLPKEQDTDYNSTPTHEALRYWTSVIKFTPAGMPDSISGSYKCPTSGWNVTIVYKVYSAPLVTAGGSALSSTNPSPEETTEMLKQMSSTESSFGTLMHMFSPRIKAAVQQAALNKLGITKRPYEDWISEETIRGSILARNARLAGHHDYQRLRREATRSVKADRRNYWNEIANKMEPQPVHVTLKISFAS
ncbi:unnamed protein product [Echinostoma caproni]|uniref:FMN_red domain-containing protein n=1 Tax=Echinostoma caproni TaxID=27848 RepID=A0A182ZZV9_9TREM|nr:unnamed protein product [Echinostoma caproni]